MILFDLKCGRGHVFEAWFRSSEDFGRQAGRQLIVCPFCGDAGVTKAPMAPNLARKGNQMNEPEFIAGTARQTAATEMDMAGGGTEFDRQSYNAPPLPSRIQTELDEVMAKVRAHVEENCDYVGERFAEEARRIHYGETCPRGIYGEATPEESLELIDEGIEIMPLPSTRRQARSDA